MNFITKMSKVDQLKYETNVDHSAVFSFEIYLINIYLTDMLFYYCY